MRIIDAHIHLNADDEGTQNLLKELDVGLLNICVAIGDWQTTSCRAFRALAHSNAGRCAWCTSFPLPSFDDSGAASADYADRVVHGISRDVAAGAVAVKAWKNIGMELQRPNGDMVLIDDVVFDPVFEYCAAEGIPMIMHIGEPRACWRPVTEPSPHADYYREHPEWHMYGREDMPSHGELVDARDRVLEKHPDLRVVGAHLGSLEYDVSEVADRLDRYPNFAVDVSARLGDLLAQDSRTVAEFMNAYSDRVIFGTDVVAKDSLAAVSEERRAAVRDSLRRTYRDYTSYFETGEIVSHAGEQAEGLALSEAVISRIYRENALEWYPALRNHREFAS